MYGVSRLYANGIDSEVCSLLPVTFLEVYAVQEVTETTERLPTGLPGTCLHNFLSSHTAARHSRHIPGTRIRRMSRIITESDGVIRC
ncbi:hypothetical protein E2C01_097955 [Portunus trituberculatus]|uniref:Uncharacterized protein n=1 Tax=Portunus trituberculatus TaxID=210409 RepID=A0A5B7K745_PORTR|nr:hypothetical protein [Portunus trituberculatus]